MRQFYDYNEDFLTFLVGEAIINRAVLEVFTALSEPATDQVMQSKAVPAHLKGDLHAYAQAGAIACFLRRFSADVQAITASLLASATPPPPPEVSMDSFSRTFTSAVYRAVWCAWDTKKEGKPLELASEDSEIGNLDRLYFAVYKPTHEVYLQTIEHAYLAATKAVLDALKEGERKDGV